MSTPFVPAAGAPQVGTGSNSGAGASTIPPFNVNISGLTRSKTTAVKSYAYIDGKKVLTTQANQMWLNLTSDEQAQVRAFAVEQGMRPSQAKTAWGQLVAASAQSYSAGVLKTPWQVLQDQQSSKPTTYTTTTRENYTPEAQTAAINTAYVKLVGRYANQDEINAIITAANKQPGSTNQTTYGTGGATTVTSPDLTPEQIATNKLMTSGEYAPERKGVQDLGFLSWLNNSISGGLSASGGQANG